MFVSSIDVVYRPLLRFMDIRTTRNQLAHEHWSFVDLTWNCIGFFLSLYSKNWILCYFTCSDKISIGAFICFKTKTKD